MTDNNVENKVKIVMNKYDKRQLRANIIKFIIGLILLALSRGYLQGHPAEKVSVFSGFEVLGKKIDVIWHNIFGGKGEILEKKYNLEKYYKELIKLAENNACISTEDYRSLEETFESLKKEVKETLEYKLPEYTKKAYMFEVGVKDDNC